MKNHSSPNIGLLSEEESNLLTERIEQTDKARSQVLDRLNDRIWKTFNDIELLYMVLSDDEFNRLFGGLNNKDGSVRAAAQHVLAFIYYGLQLADDDVKFRLRSAIEEAEAAKDRDAQVTIDITRQPFLPPEQQIQALKDGNYDQLSGEAIDRLWYDERVSASDVVEVFSALGEDDLSVEDVEAEREGAAMFERMPAPVVTNVEVNPDCTGKGED